MSIYATLWKLKFPRYGDDHTGCEWVDVVAQGVPFHIGTPSPGFGYEAGDPYADFLPPAVEVPTEEGEGASSPDLRAVVIVIQGTPKGTERSGQEYVQPLLVLSGEEYASLSFGELHLRICDALRGDRPRVIGEFWSPQGEVKLLFEDGASELIEPGPRGPRRIP